MTMVYFERIANASQYRWCIQAEWTLFPFSMPQKAPVCGVIPHIFAADYLSLSLSLSHCERSFLQMVLVDDTNM